MPGYRKGRKARAALKGDERARLCEILKHARLQEQELIRFCRNTRGPERLAARRELIDIRASKSDLMVLLGAIDSNVRSVKSAHGRGSQPPSRAAGGSTSGQNGAGAPCSPVPTNPAREGIV